jgi:hypothetical protein
MFKALFQIVVDSLVGDFADEGEVGYAHLLLLGGLEDGAFYGAFPSRSAGVSRFGAARISLTACSLGDSLQRSR